MRFRYFATAAEHQRISDGISQLDGATSGQPGAANGGTAAYGSSNVDVVDLQSAIPGTGQGQGSTTASDIGQAVSQELQQIAPDLRVTVPANSTSIMLAGSPQSIRLAKDLIAHLDRTPPLVVLDTEILEMDENVARNLGLSLGQATISSSFSEITPPNINGQFGPTRLQALGRTPISFTAVLNLQIQKGNARVLADPRITTISGHMASIRAGDTISILTQTGGGPGTPITTQIQQLQTGVTLDITPIVGANGGVTVWLHPSVNSVSPVVAGIIPTISTRDTQTVVNLRDNQTLVIGGLIQEAQSKSMSKIPIAGDIPFLGRLFRSDDINYTRNELIMVVTPHIVPAGGEVPPPNAVTLPGIPTPRPLPTLPPSTQLPAGIPQVVLTPQPILIASSMTRPTAIPTRPEGQVSPPTGSPPAATQTPSAFASANVFVYGAAPQNAYASDSDPPQIYYASLSPTIVKQGTPVTVSAITSTNISRVTIGVGGYTTVLGKVGPSKWQATYNFSTSGILSSQATTTLTLSAYRNDGVATTVQVPVSLINNQ